MLAFVLSFLTVMTLSINIPINPSLLEISTRPWLYELSQKYGKSITKLNQIPDAELKTIQSQGYNIVWFMGLWKLGAAGLQHDRTDPGLKQSYNQNLPGFD